MKVGGEVDKSCAIVNTEQLPQVQQITQCSRVRKGARHYWSGEQTSARLESTSLATSPYIHKGLWAMPYTQDRSVLQWVPKCTDTE